MARCGADADGRSDCGYIRRSRLLVSSMTSFVTASGGACLQGHYAEGMNTKVFVTGAIGALGHHLVPALISAGHEVTATTKSPVKVVRLEKWAPSRWSWTDLITMR